MSIERELFELLEPPPGGVERMRARFAKPARSRASFGLAAFGAAAAAAALALVAVLVYLPIAPPGSGVADNAMVAAPELDRLLGRDTPPVPLTVKRDDQRVQIEELPSTDPQVRIYRML